MALGGASASVIGGVPVAGSSAVEGADALSKSRVPVGPTAADRRNNLLPGDPGYLIHRAAVPGGMCVLVFRKMSGLASTLYNVIFNHRTVDDFKRSGTTVESIVAPGGGGPLIAKLGGLLPRSLGATSDESGAPKAGILPDAEAQLWADFFMVGSSFMMVAGEALGHGGYQNVYGPSLLQRRGDCPAHLPHIDQSAPVDRRGRKTKLLLANPKKPNLSLPVALQDSTCVVISPYLHRYLPEVSGGRLSLTVHPATVVLNCGDVIQFR